MHQSHGFNPRGWEKSSQVHLHCQECIVDKKQAYELYSCWRYLYLRHLFVFSSTWLFTTKTHKLILLFTLPVLPHQSTTWPLGLPRVNLDQDHLLQSQPEEQSSQLDAQAGKQTKAQLDRPLRGLPIKQQLLPSVGGFPSVRPANRRRVRNFPP